MWIETHDGRIINTDRMSSISEYHGRAHLHAIVGEGERIMGMSMQSFETVLFLLMGMTEEQKRERGAQMLRRFNAQYGTPPLDTTTPNVPQADERP